MTEWEYFYDECYFGTWRVRHKNERSFGQGFSLNNQDEAKDLCDLLNEYEKKIYDKECPSGTCIVKDENSEHEVEI